MKFKVLLLLLGCFVGENVSFDNNACKTFKGYDNMRTNSNCYYNPDIDSNLVDIVVRHGFGVEPYHVTTTDGYKLTVFRILNKDRSTIGKQPIFIQHGFLADASIWVAAGNRSLAFRLVDKGFDVWLGNYRGSIYGFSHTKLKHSDKEFWDFSFHEMGIYDLSAQIQLVVEVTKKAGKIIYIGHSMGTTGVFIYASQRSAEAKRHLSAILALAPAVYTSNSVIAKLLNPLEILSTLLMNEYGPIIFSGNGTELPIAFEKFCTSSQVNAKLCANILFVGAGPDLKQSLPDDVPVIIRRCSNVFEVKILTHYAQMGKNFQQFDYRNSKINKKNYDSKNPPEYNLAAISVPVHLYYGKNDPVTTEKDAEKLYDKLKTEKSKTKISTDDKVKFNHNDFIFAKDVAIYLHKPLFDRINKIARK